MLLFAAQSQREWKVPDLLIAVLAFASIRSCGFTTAAMALAATRPRPHESVEGAGARHHGRHATAKPHRPLSGVRQGRIEP
jgi:hypothetical protein